MKHVNLTTKSFSVLPLFRPLVVVPKFQRVILHEPELNYLLSTFPVESGSQHRKTEILKGLIREFTEAHN